MMGLDSGQDLLNSPCCRYSGSLFNAINAADGSKENPAGRETGKPGPKLVLSTAHALQSWYCPTSSWRRQLAGAGFPGGV